jgi:hypothetical protein
MCIHDIQYFCQSRLSTADYALFLATSSSPFLLYSISVTTETPVDHLRNVSKVLPVYHRGTGLFTRIHLHGNVFITQGRVCLQKFISMEMCLSMRSLAMGLHVHNIYVLVFRRVCIYSQYRHIFVSRDSAVGIATGYGLDD